MSTLGAAASGYGTAGRRRGSAEEALRLIRAQTLAIGITSDILFPLPEQQFIAEQVPGAEFTTICSTFGHDGFLLEYGSISSQIMDFIHRVKIKKLSIAGIR